VSCYDDSYPCNSFPSRYTIIRSGSFESICDLAKFLYDLLSHYDGPLSRYNGLLGKNKVFLAIYAQFILTNSIQFESN
jgi:hypothetical protein